MILVLLAKHILPVILMLFPVPKDIGQGLGQPDLADAGCGFGKNCMVKWILVDELPPDGLVKGATQQLDDFLNRFVCDILRLGSACPRRDRRRPLECLNIYLSTVRVVMSLIFISPRNVVTGQRGAGIIRR